MWLTICTAAGLLMNVLCSFVCLAITASLAAGCSESSPTATSPTTSQLSGTWNLVSIQPTGQAEQAKPADVPYTLTFADSQLSTRVDCNTCNGAFALSGQTLTAGPALACTRAACSTMPFENTYTSMLSGESAVALSGNALVLSSARGVLRFTR